MALDPAQTASEVTGACICRQPRGCRYVISA